MNKVLLRRLGRGLNSPAATTSVSGFAYTRSPDHRDLLAPSDEDDA